MTCSCGHTMSVEAGSKEEAVSKMKEMMTPETISAHASEKHPGEPVPSVEETHAMIDQKLEMVV